MLIDPRRLIKYGLGFKDVVEALDANNRQVGGQYIDRGKEQFLVRGLGRVTNVSDIANIVIATRENIPIRVRDVADVKEGPALRFGAVTHDGKEVVLGIALQRFGENAAKVASAVKAKFDVARKALPQGVTLNPVDDRTELVDKAVGMAERALIEGSVLIAIILFLFLGELRSAVVVIVALPLAMLIAFILMQAAGLSANLMSLAGLAIGIGMMVDGAVVMVENSYRLLSHHEGPIESRSEIIFKAAREVVNPIAFAILIIIVVFLPLFSLTDGVLKRFPQVVSTLATIGRAEKGEINDVNYMEINVTLKAMADWPEPMPYQALAGEMKERIEKEVPTVVVAPTQPIQSRVDELLSGVRATLALKLYGRTLRRLTGSPVKLRPCWTRFPASLTFRLKPTLASRRLPSAPTAPPWRGMG